MQYFALRTRVYGTPNATKLFLLSDRRFFNMVGDFSIDFVIDFIIDFSVDFVIDFRILREYNVVIS